MAGEGGAGPRSAPALHTKMKRKQLKEAGIRRLVTRGRLRPPGGKKVRKLDSFGKVMLLMLCFFCLDFLFSYFSVSLMTTRSQDGALVDAYSSLLDSTTFLTRPLHHKRGFGAESKQVQATVLVADSESESVQETPGLSDVVGAGPKQVQATEVESESGVPKDGDGVAESKLLLPTDVGVVEAEPVGGSGGRERQQAMEALADRGVSRQTKMRVHELKDMFGISTPQVLAQYENLCFNGSHLLTIGDSVICEQDADPDPTAFPYCALLPERCNNTRRMERLQELRTSEHGLPLGARDEAWFFRRAETQSLVWEPGTTSFLYLDRSTGNCAHFTGKINILLLFNRAAMEVPAFQKEPVERFYFVLHPERRLAHWRPMRVLERGFLATYLAVVLNRVLAPFKIGQIRARELLSRDPIVAGEGRVKMDGFPFYGASEDRPLCFQRAVVPGILKDSHYPGHTRLVPDLMRKHLAELLKVEAGKANGSSGSPPEPVVEYIRREGWRRVFVRASEEQLAAVLREMQNVTVRTVSFSNMSFQEQFTQAQEADITISLHGANLVNPTIFGRRNSVIIEMLPYRVMHRMYETQSIHSGLIYMGHQLEQATPQERDDGEFSGLTFSRCMFHPACKYYFVHIRNVELTPQDLLHIQSLLATSRRLHLDLIRKGVAPDSSPRFEQDLVRILQEETGVQVACGPYRELKNDTCRNTWIGFADNQGLPRLCYVASRCISSNSTATS